jgi:hypothetical protein
MSCANRLWGAPRIHGELLKLGFEVWRRGSIRAASTTMIYLTFFLRAAAPANETTNAWFLFGLRPIASAASDRKY